MALVAAWFLSLFALYEVLSTKLVPPTDTGRSFAAAHGRVHGWASGEAAYRSSHHHGHGQGRR
jgi:hypothetical protein